MKIAVIVTARPSYARVKTAIQALINRGAEVHILACASALLERYGKVVEVIRKDFPQAQLEEVYSTYEGANLITSAKETGALTSELASALSRVRPAWALVVADRHEVLGAAQAASYLHVPLAHVQGGEVSGSIDNKVRDSITQLADLHLVATKRAAMRVYALTGNHEAVHVVGCPSIDIAKQALDEPPVTSEELGGAGAPIDLNRPFVVVLQHSVTNEASESGEQMRMTLKACEGLGQVLVLWPGEDAGQEAAAKAIRMTPWVHTVRNLPPSRFLKVLTQSKCLIGNSSVGIRECSWLGVPVVNIGSRQTGRERGPNVVDVGHDVARIRHGILGMAGSSPRRSDLYGHGDAGERIADVLLGKVALSA